MTPVVVVMGVSGAGKSTVGAALATRLGWDFVDGDDLHPQTNLAKMAGGVALTDEDRGPWLRLVRERIEAQQADARPGVVACSALKRSYRDMLRGPGVVLVQLSADPARLEHRLRNRAGHFMRAGMLGSQLDTLEPPAPEENVLTVDTAPSVDAVVDAIITAYDLDTWQAG
jgi:gluconokinase